MKTCQQSSFDSWRLVGYKIVDRADNRHRRHLAAAAGVTYGWPCDIDAFCRPLSESFSDSVRPPTGRDLLQTDQCRWLLRYLDVLAVVGTVCEPSCYLQLSLIAIDRSLIVELIIVWDGVSIMVAVQGGSVLLLVRCSSKVLSSCFLFWSRPLTSIYLYIYIIA